MIAAYVLLGSFGSLCLFWLLWIVISGFHRAQAEGRLTPFAITVGTGISYFGLVWDVLCNLLLCTFLFLDIPREPTLSQRLRRLVLTTGWRREFAEWVSEALINPFSTDPADPHIHLEGRV